MKLKNPIIFASAAALFLAPTLVAQDLVLDFEDLDEGFHGIPFEHQGVTFSDLNSVSGVFPNGDTFGPQEFDECIIEDATLWYNDFPGWGSPVNVLTFGTAYIPGENLSLGRLSNVTLDLPQVANSVSFDLGYYENGPWGGIEFHVDAIARGEVVGSQSFMIKDGGGRDNGAAYSFMIDRVEFDQVKIYAMYGEDYSLPRAIIDNLSFNWNGGGGATLTQDPDPLIGGQKASFLVTNAKPSTKTYLAYSVNGKGPTFVPFLNVSLDLSNPKQAGNTKSTDDEGAVLWTLPIPAKYAGVFVWLQAAQYENTTNVVGSTIQ